MAREIPIHAASEPGFDVAVKTYRVKDTIRRHADVPCIGFVEYLVTRVDETGIYGIITRNTVRDMTMQEAM